MIIKVGKSKFINLDQVVSAFYMPAGYEVDEDGERSIQVKARITLSFAVPDFGFVDGEGATGLIEKSLRGEEAEEVYAALERVAAINHDQLECDYASLGKDR